MWYGICRCTRDRSASQGSATRCAAAAQAIKDGRIAAVGVGLVDAGVTAKEIYDATGQHVAPGWIDPHTHFVRCSCVCRTATVG